MLGRADGGADQRPSVAGWHLIDLDWDGDVDLADFAEWQGIVWSGGGEGVQLAITSLLI